MKHFFTRRKKKQNVVNTKRKTRKIALQTRRRFAQQIKKLVIKKTHIKKRVQQTRKIVIRKMHTKKRAQQTKKLVIKLKSLVPKRLKKIARVKRIKNVHENSTLTLYEKVGSVPHSCGTLFYAQDSFK